MRRPLFPRPSVPAILLANLLLCGTIMGSYVIDTPTYERAVQLGEAGVCAVVSVLLVLLPPPFTCCMLCVHVPPGRFAIAIELLEQELSDKPRTQAEILLQPVRHRGLPRPPATCLHLATHICQLLLLFAACRRPVAHRVASLTLCVCRMARSSPR